VQKPIFGSEGRGLVRWDEPGEGAKWWRILAQNQQVCYLQAYIDHGGRDYRLLVVGDEVFGLQRQREDDWRLNLSRGAHGQAYRLSASEQDLAQRCAAICGASVCGVDLVYDRHGAPWILEVNASPGWRGISTVGEVDIAQTYLRLFDRL
jgi:RimK family alpha-L-glutamate ligase